MIRWPMARRRRALDTALGAVILIALVFLFNRGGHFIVATFGWRPPTAPCADSFPVCLQVGPFLSQVVYALLGVVATATALTFGAGLVILLWQFGCTLADFPRKVGRQVRVLVRAVRKNSY